MTIVYALIAVVAVAAVGLAIWLLRHRRSYTTLTVTGAARFPAAPFNLLIGEEIVRVVKVDGAVMTVRRGRQLKP